MHVYYFFEVVLIVRCTVVLGFSFSSDIRNVCIFQIFNIYVNALCCSLIDSHNWFPSFSSIFISVLDFHFHFLSHFVFCPPISLVLPFHLTLSSLFLFFLFIFQVLPKTSSAFHPLISVFLFTLISIPVNLSPFSFLFSPHEYPSALHSLFFLLCPILTLFATTNSVSFLIFFSFFKVPVITRPTFDVATKHGCSTH